MTDDEPQSLEEQNQAQEVTIKKLWVRLTAIEKRDRHAQAHITRLEARIDQLQAGLTPEAKANWIFTN